ncbi:GNAT family N-acetyltransferase [Kineosporia sp. J2-2]|uniref:GNAT family N-acetyltransferase n=1 Tax=Kineosporia corallincola TaxID=2835133 RepID=A0ABS5TK51_9ACTN|nr:GNAT family N-acetyltransferase [Kineosporia corallincola]MBT0771472.1 GNAT family N-acetyltransferase [Kineosporia corallincola]
MTTLSVRPMTPPEFADWQRELARVYSAEQVAAGRWAAEGAFRRALDENAASLPQGLDTPGMLLLKGVLADGTVIGRVWIGLEHPRGTPDCAFLYDIEVDEPHRGRGLGRALLTAAEQAVAERGVGALELNVFGDNASAIGLYGSAGYTVITQQMRKQVRP